MVEDINQILEFFFVNPSNRLGTLIVFLILILISSHLLYRNWRLNKEISKVDEVKKQLNLSAEQNIKLKDQLKSLGNQHHILRQEYQEIKDENQKLFKSKKKLIEEKEQLQQQRTEIEELLSDEKLLRERMEREKQSTIDYQEEDNLRKKFIHLLDSCIPSLKKALRQIPATSRNHKNWQNFFQEIVDGLRITKEKVIKHKEEINKSFFQELMEKELKISLNRLFAFNAYSHSIFNSIDDIEININTELKKRFDLPVEIMSNVYNNINSFFQKELDTQFINIGVGDSFNTKKCNKYKYHQLGNLGMGWIFDKLPENEERIYDVVSFGVEPNDFYKNGKKVNVVLR